MTSEALIRLGVFLSVFAIMALWEWKAPLRDAPRKRWGANLGLVVIDTLIIRLLFPAAAVGAAMDASSSGIGLFNLLAWPSLLEVILAFVILDLAIWAQHVTFHQVPWLWRLHMVHHADEAMDVTTGLRFHPVEIAISMAIKIALVYALGASALAVILFEVLLNASAMWSHSNFSPPARLEKILRLLIVTPDMHRSHHSVVRQEHDTNYGFFLSIWDRLFGLYTETPAGGQKGVKIGLPFWRDGQSAGLLRSLLLPFGRMK